MSLIRDTVTAQHVSVSVTCPNKGILEHELGNSLSLLLFNRCEDTA